MFRSKVGDGALIEHLHDGVNGMQPPGTGEDYGTPCYYYEEAE